jgi:prolyl oligopeptidase
MSPRDSTANEWLHGPDGPTVGRADPSPLRGYDDRRIAALGSRRQRRFPSALAASFDELACDVARDVKRLGDSAPLRDQARQLIGGRKVQTFGKLLGGYHAGAAHLKAAVLAPGVRMRCDGQMRALRYLVLLAAAATLAGAAETTYFAYVGTYTGRASEGIYVYRFDPATGAATPLGLAAKTENPSFLAVRPDGEYLYAVNEINPGRVSAFRIDRKTGKLTALNQVSSHGDGPCALAVDRAGKYVIAANYGSGSVAVFPIRADGGLAEASAVEQHKGSSVNPGRQAGPHAHFAVFSPDDRFALSADLGTDRIYVDRFDGAHGTLEPLAPAAIAPGSGPRHLVFHPNGKFVYVLSEMLATVTAFTWDDGALKEFQTVPALPAGYRGAKGAAEIQVHPNGKFLYASNRGDANDIAIFSIDEASGRLTPAGHVLSGGRTPRYFGFDPTGKYVLAANQNSNAIVVFRADAATGSLTATGKTIAISAPVCVQFAAAPPLSAQAPPATRTDNVTEVIHGVKISDPYRWLEDQNSPETRAWIEKQNAYTRSVLDRIPEREAIRKRLNELMRFDDTRTPVVAGGRYFFLRRAADADQATLYVREGGKDRVLVAPKDSNTAIELEDVTPDGKVVAYGERHGGQDEVAITLLDVDSGKELPDKLPRGRYSVALRPDHKGFFYDHHTDLDRIFYHPMGGDQVKDRQIFGDGYGAEYAMDASVSEDGRYLVIHVVHGSAADQTEIHVQNLEEGGPIQPVVKGIPARFFGGAEGDTLFVQTNWKAPNGRMLAIDLRRPAQEQWREIVPEGPDAIEHFSLAAGRVFVGYVHDVSTLIRVFDPDGKPLGEVPLPSIGSAGGMSGRWSGKEAFFRFESFHTPPSVWRYDPAAGTITPWARPEVPLDASRLEVKQVWYASKDGTRIPMFLMYRKGLALDGRNPVYLTGYGGFTISMTPSYSAPAALWAERGGVLAVPSLRGGGEFGEKWHLAGMRANKQNVFDDFIAAAEWLIRNRFTSPAELAIGGGSNGGLLVGAAMTQRPDLFRAVACTYPLLDMLRYDRFLVAKWWVPEYGSASDPEQFKWLYAYSPYQHVKAGVKYPAVLFVTGDSDTRVAPLHARKMTALVQASTASGLPVLLRYDTHAGHSRGQALGAQIDERADILSFLWWQLAGR